MPFARTKPMQRIRYSPEQLLKAADLNDDEQYQSTVRRMHVRGLHDTWGVALGFFLSLSNQHDQVLTGPGLAYDAMGRELLLAETLAIPAPEPPAGSAVPLAYDLVVSQRSNAEVLALRRRQASCGGHAAAEGVQLRWALAGAEGSPKAELLSTDVRLGIEVPLGRFILDPFKKALSGPDMRFRYNARPLLRPHIAFGKLTLGELGFTRSNLDVSTTIFTTEGGFSSIPQYFVSLPQNPLLKAGLTRNILGPFLSVSNPSYNHFRLRAFFAAGDLGGEELKARMTVLLDEAASLPLYWVGVEPVAGCQPNPSFTFVYLPIGILLQNAGLMWSAAMKSFGNA